MLKILLIMTLICVDVYAGSAGTMRVKKSNIVRVYDGDTFYINIKRIPKVFGENIGVRIYGIDTPESRTKDTLEKKMAHIAKDSLTNILMTAKKIQLKNVQRDKYFRLLAEVFVNDTLNVAQHMIDIGLAKEYYGGKKEKFNAGE